MRRALAGALLTAALTTGCGGNGGASASQLRIQAARICTTGYRRLGQIRTPGLEPTDRAFLVRGVAALEPTYRGLSSLHPQGEDRPVYGSALAALGQEIAELRRSILALDRHQDPALAFAALQRRLAPLEAQADAAWRALQVPACLTR